jgi:hypothetical protein
VKFKRNEERSEKKYLLTSRWRTVPREAVAAAAGFDITNVGLWSFMTFNQNIFAETWCYEYRKVASSNTSCLKAHAGFFRLLGMKGIFDPYIIYFCQKVTVHNYVL